MSNEYHDVVKVRAAELGFVADHEAVHGAREVSAAGELFEAVTTAAFEHGASLTVAGLRVLALAERCGRMLPKAWLKAQGMTRLRFEREARSVSVVEFATDADAQEIMAVFDLLIGREEQAARIGRRVSLIAYALTPNVVVMKSLPNLGGIGKLWELTASNKRSAVCEAMNVLRAELVRWSRLPRQFRFWFEKQHEARMAYAAAAMGNHNRVRGMLNEECGMMTETEPLEAREDTIFRTKEGRKRMDQRWAEAEARRLERLVIPRE